MSVVNRVKAIREAEGLSQREFCQETGLVLDTLRNYEQGKRASIGSKELEKITTHPRFTKYALWLVTGEAAPEAGQISPDIEGERSTA